jgi:hypothetical protein
MSLESCRAAIAHERDKEIAEKVHAACASVCGCEAFSLGDGSPGPVEDPENLHLVISDPQSLLPDLTLNPASLVQIDYAGLSVLRDRAADGEFELTISELKARSASTGKERFFHGVCTFTASTIRYNGVDRFLCIYDTAMPGKPHHADIFGPDLRAMSGGAISKSEREKQNRQRIKQLIDRIGASFEPAQVFRNGVLAAYSRPAV